MSKIFNIFLSVFLVFIISWLGFSFYKAYQPKEQVLQGQIQAREYSISSKIAGRIEKLYVKKGDMIKKDDLVFSISSPELDAKIQQARAMKNAANALYDEAKEGTREEKIKASYDEYQKASSALELYEKTYQRIHALFKDGVVSKQKNDEAFTKYQTMVHTKNAAYELYKMAKKGASEQTKKAALSKAHAAKSALSEVEAYAQDLLIKSPFSGEVSNILLYPGELSAKGFPIVQVIDMNQSWLSFQVKETQLERFKKGSIFKASIPALGFKTYEFKVSFVSPLGAFATWRATNTRNDFDMRTYEIEAYPTKKIPDLRVGMSVLIKL